MFPLSHHECYVSVDIEADGPCPGLNSMLSIGAAAFDADGHPDETFSVNLDLLEGARPDPRTMDWWETQPDAWAACRTDLAAPKLAIRRFYDFLHILKRRVGVPVMVAYPASYDSLWIQWYFSRFMNRSPFGRRVIDIKTLAMTVLGNGYSHAAKRNMPIDWFPPERHSHVAVEDAIEQGQLFFNVLREIRR